MKRQRKEALLRQLLSAMGGAAPGAFPVDEQGNLIEAADEDATLSPVQELAAFGMDFAASGSEWVCGGEEPDDASEPENDSKK